MHSSEPAGPGLALQVARLVVRARSPTPAPRAHPSTSQIQTQPKHDSEELKPGLDAQLHDQVQALWHDQIPLCIDVYLAPTCAECRAAVTRGGEALDRHSRRAILLERWTMNIVKANVEGAVGGAQWTVSAVRSALHFSQLSAWRDSRRRRQLNGETCNIKKAEANYECPHAAYVVRAADGRPAPDFLHPPTSHQFPLAPLSPDHQLQINLHSLPRLDHIPTVQCTCQKRKVSKDSTHYHEDIIGKLNDLNIGTKLYTDAMNTNIKDQSRMSDSNEYLNEDQRKLVDDRMLTPCSENGKHKCNCDDESDGKDIKGQQTKKLDERRLKEIAKYKRRIRKENKLRKLCDSTSSEGDQQKTKEIPTSIPILQASRFDRFRAIGCYRNQTYLTLPASRIETKSPFTESVNMTPVEFKKTNTIGTQTDEVLCSCGALVQFKCDLCSDNRLVRSDASYDLTTVDKEKMSTRRKCEDEGIALKKLKCDNINTDCDNIENNVSGMVRRPALRRCFPVNDAGDNVEADTKELNLQPDDTVFSVPKQEAKRQKTFSINDEDYVLYEKCDYGTIDRAENESIGSPKEMEDEFKFPDKVDGSDMSKSDDKFKWTYDSRSSTVFNKKTGLPLNSSPAPLRRGKNCFDFDDSIKGVSEIKSALYRPVSGSDSQPPPPGTPPPTRLRLAPSAGLLGSFEECLLQGRLAPVSLVTGFEAELAAVGGVWRPHRRLPATVAFYTANGTHAPYVGHIPLSGGYRVSRAGRVQVSLFNPHGTLVRMFVVRYDLSRMPPLAKTFVRQRTLYLPAGADPPTINMHKWLRYLIHLRFMTSKSGKLFLHTDIRILVSRKADLDTATAYSLFRPLTTNDETKDNTKAEDKNDDNTENEKHRNNPTNSFNDNGADFDSQANVNQVSMSNSDRCVPNRVFGGSSEYDSEFKSDMKEIGYENQNGVCYELRSFTYAPDNSRYSPR